MTAGPIRVGYQPHQSPWCGWRHLVTFSNTHHHFCFLVKARSCFHPGSSIRSNVRSASATQLPTRGVTSGEKHKVNIATLRENSVPCLPNTWMTSQRGFFVCLMGCFCLPLVYYVIRASISSVMDSKQVKEMIHLRWNNPFNRVENKYMTNPPMCALKIFEVHANSL